jgi:hypothetical protein
MVRVWVFMIAICSVLLFAAWASDFITMQGERTVYTVECRDGAWAGERCAGTLVAGQRYRYRALTAHKEVIFWTVGTGEPSGKFAECEIKDGRNWVCKPNGDVSRSITLQMAEGVPIAGAQTRPFRAVSKWRWMLLKRGFGAGGDVPPALVAAPST